MFPKNNPFVLLQNQYFLFTSIVIFSILLTQAFIELDLNRQEHDAQNINLAGKQRALSQRIIKTVFYCKEELLNDDVIHESTLDTLRMLTQQFKKTHYVLIEENRQESWLAKSDHAYIDSVLVANSPHLEAILKASTNVIEEPNLVTVDRSLKHLRVHEQLFSSAMHLTVMAYQRGAETKLRNTKNVVLSLAILSILILSFGFFFLLLPLTRRLKTSNVMLQQVNQDNAAANEELKANEKEITNNLHHILELKQHLEIREQQYRELVESATDMIYELDEKGQFTYVNPVMEKLSGHTREELSKKVYWEIVDPDYKEQVLSFYVNQRRQKQEHSYYEFPMMSKNQSQVWVGQNVRMFFEGSWVWKVRAVSRDITAIRKANQALQSSEELFRTLAEKAPVGIYRLDKNGKPLFLNKKWYEVSGLSTHHNDSETSHVQAIHYEDRERIVKAWKHAIENKTDLELEFRYETRAKGITWVSNQLSAIRNSEGETTGFVGTMSNITLIKDAQQKIQESEKLFRLLSEEAPIGIFQTDTDGQATFMNKRWCEITGITEREALGQGWAKVIHDDDRPGVFQAWIAALKKRSEFNMEFRFVNPTLGVRWVVCKAIQILDGGDKMMGYIGTVDDITELKAVQQKLLERERLYRLISTNAKDLISLYPAEPNPKRIFVSPSVKEILGYEPEELIGKSAFDYMVPEDAERMRTEVHPITLSGTVTTAQYRHYRKDGSIIWLESNSQPIFDDYGNLTSFQTSARDITKRKEFEEALQAAKQKAEEATLAKSQFLSVMSHEIRTPMNAIIGLTNLLIQDQPRPDQVEHLRLLKFSGENLLTIINDVLDFNKIEAGKIVLENIDFDLYSLVSDIKNMLDQEAEEKGIHVYTQFNKHVPRVIKGDPVRLGQIITNLVGNAIKFTERGYIEVVVNWGGFENGKHNLQFSIKDTGIGIAPENIQTIFDSFTQARSDTTRKFGGTGLGLSITKRLLNLMNSDIILESQVGQGSEFSFVIWVEEGKLDSKAGNSANGASSIQSDYDVKVLLVEDNRINQIVASNFLKKWRIDIDIANNGKEAVALIKNKSYQLILMDLQMPEMDGYEATKIIRSFNDDPYYTNIPVIALTASAMSDISEKALASGMNDFLSKPFQPLELHAKLEKYLSKLSKPPMYPANHTYPLTVNLDPFTEGDEDFKKEISTLLIKNLEEFRKALEEVINTRNFEKYKLVSHKLKPTLGILGNPAFAKIEESIRQIVSHSPVDLDQLEMQAGLFRYYCERLTEVLKSEVIV